MLINIYEINFQRAYFIWKFISFCSEFNSFLIVNVDVFCYAELKKHAEVCIIADARRMDSAVIFQGGKTMASNINGNINQLFRGANNEPRTGTVSSKPRGPSKSDSSGKKTAALDKFGESAKVSLSPEAEMYGKVVDLLQSKYDNADVFVAGPNDDLSQIGGEQKYSIILSEDEMKLLASDDPKDKEAKEKLMGQIDEAMTAIKDMSDKIGENTGEDDEVSNYGIKLDKNGKMSFFADINGKSFADTTMDSLMKSIMSDKTAGSQSVE